MKKIPTLYQRSEDRRSLTTEVTPGCEWVLDGEGRATRKWDGTCVLIRRDGLAIKGFARREVKPKGVEPLGFIEVDHDEVTGKRVGWEPIINTGFRKFFEEAVNEAALQGVELVPGTYELIGPKINGNPEGSDLHQLIPHGDDPFIMGLPEDPADSFEYLKSVFTDDETFTMEGLVWHHEDGRMVKLKKRDFKS